MKNSAFLLLSAVILVFQSCIRTEEIGTPWETEIKPVVFSVLSVDQVPGVFLGQTYHPDNPLDSIPYPQAKVFMAVENQDWVEFFRKDSTSQYFIDKEGKIRIEKGKKYRLKVQIDDKMIEAETMMPEQVGKILSANCVLHQIEPNVSYGINGLNVLMATLTATLSLPQSEKSFCFIENDELNYSSGNLLKTENFVDKNFFVPEDSTSFVLNVKTITPELKLYLIAQQLTVSYDDEFLPEIFMGTFTGVLPPYNNINGGTGLFAAVWKEQFRVQIRQ